LTQLSRFEPEKSWNGLSHFQIPVIEILHHRYAHAVGLEAFLAHLFLQQDGSWLKHDLNHSRAAPAVAQALLTVIASKAHESLKLPNVVEALFEDWLLLAMHVDELHDSSTQFHGVFEYLLLGLHGVICILGVLVDLIDTRNQQTTDWGRLRLKSAQDGYALLRKIWWLLCFEVVAVIAAQAQWIQSQMSLGHGALALSLFEILLEIFKLLLKGLLVLRIDLIRLQPFNLKSR
jgi:hypothetical protein